jgi:hypothetical protein
MFAAKFDNKLSVAADISMPKAQVVDKFQLSLSPVDKRARFRRDGADWAPGCETERRPCGRDRQLESAAEPTIGLTLSTLEVLPLQL